MNSRFVIATLVGAVVLFVAGFVIFGLAFNSFYLGNQGTATGVNRDTMEWPWLIASTLASAALLTLVLGWAGARAPVAGFKVAAIIGLLTGAAFDFGVYSMTNVQSLTITLVDPILVAIQMGIGGAVIGMMLGQGETAS